MRAKIIGEAFGTFFLCFALLLGGGPLPLAALLAALTYLAAPAGFPALPPHAPTGMSVSPPRNITAFA